MFPSARTLSMARLDTDTHRQVAFEVMVTQLVSTCNAIVFFCLLFYLSNRIQNIGLKELTSFWNCLDCKYQMKQVMGLARKSQKKEFK